MVTCWIVWRESAVVTSGSRFDYHKKNHFWEVFTERWIFVSISLDWSWQMARVLFTFIFLQYSWWENLHWLVIFTYNRTIELCYVSFATFLAQIWVLSTGCMCEESKLYMNAEVVVFVYAFKSISMMMNDDSLLYLSLW